MHGKLTWLCYTKPLNNGIFATCECSFEMNLSIKDLENKAKTLYSVKLSSINTKVSLRHKRNGNHNISLPIIFEKYKGDQMLPSSYISSLLVSFYGTAFNSCFNKCQALFWAKMVIFAS